VCHCVYQVDVKTNGAAHNYLNFMVTYTVVLAEFLLRHTGSSAIILPSVGFHRLGVGQRRSDPDSDCTRRRRHGPAESAFVRITAVGLGYSPVHDDVIRVSKTALTA